MRWVEYPSPFAVAHSLPSQLTVDPLTPNARLNMGSRTPRVVIACLVSSMGDDRLGTVVAHPALRRDFRDLLELGFGAASCRACLTVGDTQMAGGTQRPDTVDGHHSEDLALTRVELGHEVRGTGHAIRQLDRLERPTNGSHSRHGSVELDPLPRAEASEVPAFVVLFATVIDRAPESANQMLFVFDNARGFHHDGRDRVVHDVLLRGDRDASRLAAPAEL
jgi:hypothetical protein